MKTIFVVIFLMSITLSAQIVPDSTAQANGWIKIQPKVYNNFEKVPDTVAFFNIENFVILRDNKTVDLYINGYSTNGVKLVSQKRITMNATELFDLTWANYPTMRKNRVIIDLNLTEIPY